MSMRTGEEKPSDGDAAGTAGQEANKEGATMGGEGAPKVDPLMGRRGSTSSVGSDGMPRAGRRRGSNAGIEGILDSEPEDEGEEDNEPPPPAVVMPPPGFNRGGRRRGSNAGIDSVLDSESDDDDKQTE